MDVLEQNAFMTEGVNISEKLSGFRKNFTSAIGPENGSYGIIRIDKGDNNITFTSLCHESKENGDSLS